MLPPPLVSLGHAIASKFTRSEDEEFQAVSRSVLPPSLVILGHASFGLLFEDGAHEINLGC